MLRFNGFSKLLLILSILCYLTRPGLSQLSNCRNAFADGIDYFPDKVFFDDDGQGNPEFIVTYFNSYIVATNNKVPETYVLYCTEFQPVVLNNATKFIQIPVTNVAIFDRPTISFLEILGEERSLKYVGDKNAITSPCLLKYNDLYENMIVANTNQVASVDVIFTDKPQPGGKFVTVSVDEDATALRKAQWIKFVSLFFNKAAVANNAYNKVRSNYLCHSANVDNIPKQTRKTIAWVSFESSNNFTVKFQSFYTNSTLSAAAFPLQDMMPSDLTVDALQRIIDDAYIVIDMSHFVAPFNTLDAWKHYFGYDQVANLPRFLKEKRLYRTRKLINKMDYDDWTESSPSRPDILLQDLIAIQYPLYQTDYMVTWFDKFAETGDNVYISDVQCNDNTFGFPKTDFGTCRPMNFFGDGKDNSGNQINKLYGKPNGNKTNNNNGENKGESKAEVQPGVIVAVVLTGSLILFGLGALVLVILRRKYRERFVKLRDEPVNSVKEPVVQMDSVKEVK